MKKVSNVKEMHENAMKGHNTDELIKNYVTNVTKLQIQMEKINGQIKDELNKAKKDGILKTSLRKAIKNLRMTQEQMQAKKEVDLETQRITDLCCDLPLFANAA